ncbi:MAG: hypothetical protein ABSD70_04015 [Terracidiphilus sp.]|jgi:hypothetical protein
MSRISANPEARRDPLAGTFAIHPKKFPSKSAPTLVLFPLFLMISQ